MKTIKNRTSLLINVIALICASNTCYANSGIFLTGKPPAPPTSPPASTANSNMETLLSGFNRNRTEDSSKIQRELSKQTTSIDKMSQSIEDLSKEIKNMGGTGKTLKRLMKLYTYQSFQQTPTTNGADYFVNSYTMQQQYNFRKLQASSDTQISKIMSGFKAAALPADDVGQSVIQYSSVPFAFLKYYKDSGSPCHQYAAHQYNENTPEDEDEDAKKTREENMQKCIDTQKANEAQAKASSPKSDLLALTRDIPGADQLIGGSTSVASFSFNTLISGPKLNPTSPSNLYKYESNYARNYLRLITNDFLFNKTWYRSKGIQAVYQAIAQVKKQDGETHEQARNRIIQKIQGDQDYLAYKAQYRTSLTRKSLITSVLTQLKQERTGTQASPSALLTLWKLNHWRLNSPTWYKYIKHASSISLQREQTLMQAQALANQYQQHIDNEKIEALLALLNQQLFDTSLQASNDFSRNLADAMNKMGEAAAKKQAEKNKEK